MNRIPLVSLCIPTYNGAPYLQETLDCVNSQEFDDLEIIISDSGSSDGTIEIVQRFQSSARFPVRILPPPPKGMVANWNHCVTHATGRYIKFLFQDDLLTPDCISRLVALAEEDSEIGLVFSPRTLLFSDDAANHAFCQSMEVESKDVHLGWSDLKRIQDGRTLLADAGLVTNGALNKVGEPSVVLLRRETIQQVGCFDLRLRQVVDLEMWWRVMGHCKVGFIDAPLATFRIHSQQMSVQNSHPLRVIAELKSFAQIAIGADYSSEFATTTRQQLQQMAGKNLFFQYLYLQYRKPIHWAREQLGLQENESWRMLFGRYPSDK